MMTLLALRLRIFCVSFEAFEWQLSDDEDEIQYSIGKLWSKSPKTLNWHLVKPVLVNIQHESEDPC